MGIYFIAKNDKDDVQKPQQYESINSEIDESKVIPNLEKVDIEEYVSKIYKYGSIVKLHIVSCKNK